MNRRHYPKRRARSAIVAVLVVGALIGSGVSAWQYMDTDTKIGPTPAPVVSKVLGAKSKTRTYTTGPGDLVNIDLPQDWEKFTPASALAGSYNWRNTAGNKGVRTITLYVDAIPQDFAVNRVLAVEGVENRIITLGGVSENCVNFSGQGRDTTGSGKAPARWEGVRFTCDTGNYVRNVVGISSAATPGAVKLTGTSGAHQLFVTYTDSDATPNHSIFTAAVESMRLK